MTCWDGGRGCFDAPLGVSICEMKTLQLPAVGAALSGLLILAAAEAEAQQPVAGSGPRMTIPRDGGPFGGHFRGGHRRGGKFHGGHFPSFILVERSFDYAQDERVVIVEREAPPPTPPPPAPSPEGEGKRKPYVIGNSYASLPGGCMKMIEEGVSYYWCSGGEWYRLVGKQYRAVAKP